MAHKHLDTSRGTLFLAFLVVATLLLLIPDKHTRQLNDLFLRVFDPLLSVGAKLPNIIPRPAPRSEEFVERDKYDELWKAYKNSVAALSAMQKDYEKLSGIRQGLPRLGGGLVLAQVMKTTVSGYGHELAINKGTIDGIDKGQYVLGPNISSPDKSSIVGTISEVFESTARVRLLTDPKQNIIVSIERSGKIDPAEFQLVGDGVKACKIPLVSRQTKISQGDTIFAAPRQGLLDTAVVIGEITAAVPDQSKPLLWDITVEPVYDASGLGEVGVIAMTGDKK